MKFTVDRIENGIALCESSAEEAIIKKEFPVSSIPFDIKEGTVFTAAEVDEKWEFELTESDIQESGERKKRVRKKLNKLFGRKD